MQPNIVVHEKNQIKVLSNKVAPVEINRARFIEMLAVLPPIGWKTEGNTETFKLSERRRLGITQIFCRIGSRYFGLIGSVKLSHAEIVQRCSAL